LAFDPFVLGTMAMAALKNVAAAALEDEEVPRPHDGPVMPLVATHTSGGAIDNFELGRHPHVIACLIC
jgi:hypothetical protein